jgi:type I restriction enzyme S subunit
MGTMPFVFAGNAICEAFGRLVGPIFSRMRAAADEARTLAETRDYLLPRLMSGEVHVSEAEEATTAALARAS